MASEWAKKRVNELVKDSDYAYTIEISEALDAAAEDFYNAMIKSATASSAGIHFDSLEDVLDKLGR